MRARYYAVLPLKYDVFSKGDRNLGAYLRRKLIVYRHNGDSITFDHIIAYPIQMKKNIPYMMYYLEERDRRVLLSLIPTDHP